jgi:hypothetical protein
VTLTPGLFARDIEWTPHVFDSNEEQYVQRCPQGGPGGMICCETCTANYSEFLSATCRDIEVQTTVRVGEEVTELMEFLVDAKSRLSQSMRAAKRKPPPLRLLTDPSSDVPGMDHPF